MTETGLASRTVALNLVQHVLGRRKPLDGVAFDVITRDCTDSRDKGYARAIALTVLRRRGQIDAIINVFVKKPLGPRQVPVMNILRVALAQLLFLDAAPHAVVNLAVAQAGAHPRARHWKGLVNAVLRTAVRDAPALVAKQDEACLNTPNWLMASWRAAYGEVSARAIALAHLEEPPLDLTLKPEIDSGAHGVSSASLPDGIRLATGSLRVRHAGPVEALPGYGEGLWWVQDAAAALPVRLAGLVKGLRAFDLCAAPGGKTVQLAAAGAVVTAVDQSAQRLEQVKANLGRLGLEARIVSADAEHWRPARTSPDNDQGQAAIVLLDAPCSATGAIRRHPDIAWLKQPEDVSAMAALQRRLLDHAATLTAPGGLLIYCVCSLQPEEGEQQAADFLARQPLFRRRRVSAAEAGLGGELVNGDGDIRSLPCHLAELGGLDGFFVARFVRAGGLS